MNSSVQVFAVVSAILIGLAGFVLLIRMDVQGSETKRWDIEYVVGNEKTLVKDARSVNVGAKSLEYVDEQKQRVVIFPKPTNIKCIKTHE